MRKLLAIAVLALACAREQRPHVVPLMPKRCEGLCGKVIDVRTKQPVREFIVYLFANRPPNVGLPPGYPVPPGPMIEERVIESNDGSFGVNAPREAVFVGVSARGYKSTTTSKPVDASLPVVIGLTPARRIAGRVADEQGRPVANAHAGEATSDEHGNFEIYEPPAEWQQLDVSDEKHLPSRVIVRSEDSHIDVTLRDALPLSGTVVDEHGAPLADAGVRVVCGEFAPEPQLSRPDGSFSFHVPRARCTLVAGRGLQNDDVEHAVVPTEPRTILDIDMTNGLAGVLLRVPAQR